MKKNIDRGAPSGAGPGVYGAPAPTLLLVSRPMRESWHVLLGCFCIPDNFTTIIISYPTSGVFYMQKVGGAQTISKYILTGKATKLPLATDVYCLHASASSIIR